MIGVNLNNKYHMVASYHHSSSKITALLGGGPINLIIVLSRQGGHYNVHLPMGLKLCT